MEETKLSFENVFVHGEHRDQLRKALQDTLGSSRVHAVLVGGTSGSGKSRLVHSSFAPEHEKSELWFATAKFERKERAPFSVIRRVITEITELIMKSKSQTLLDACRAALESEVSSYPRNKEILVDMIPESVELLETSVDSSTEEGEVQSDKSAQSEESTAFSTDDVNTLRLALRSFLRAVSSVLPTVLFLDDIMWSDNNTLEMFEYLLTDAGLTNVLLCATYRDDEVDETHPFSHWQERVQAGLKDNEVRSIKVANLEVPQVQRLLSDLLHLDEDEVADFAELLQTRTNGNLFYLIQMLEKMCNLNLLKFEYVSFTYKWTFTLDDARRMMTHSDNVGELVSSRIEQLEKPVQNILKFAACFGSRVEVRALETIRPAMMGDIVDIRALLDRACQEMMLIKVSETTCKFAHDQIQAAAYALLSSSDEAKKIHQRIGNLLLHSVATLEDQTLTFVCADQLKRGYDTFETSEDPVAIAKLSLAAGRKAAAISAFMMASDFFKLGINALGGLRGFDREYDLALELYSLYARTEQCGGSISESKKAAETVLAHATTEEDKVSAFRTLLSCFLAANQMNELIEFGLDLCEKLGEKIPKNPKACTVDREVEKGRKVLLKMTNADILSLPSIQDRNKELCMNVFYELAMPAYYVGNHLLHYSIVSRMNKITLEHGLSKWSPKSFALSGQHFTANHNDFKEGYRYAQLALILLGNYNKTKRGGSVIFHVAIIKACIEPAASCLDLLLTGYRISMEAGHINFAVTNIFNYFWTFFYSGLPFGPLLEDIEKFSTQMLDYKRNYWFLMSLPVWQCLLNLSGRADNCSNMEVGDAIGKESLVGGNPNGAGRQTLLSYWMQLSFYLGNMEKAAELYKQLKDFDMGAFKATMFFNARIFFFALIEMHNFRVTGKGKCKKNAKRYRDILRKHVAGGAINLVSKVQLLDAEIMKRTSKNSNEVLQKYRGAIASATRSGFLQDAALFNVLFAEHCQATSALEVDHKFYVQKAHESYISWGASEVARSLEKRYPDVFRGADSSSLKSSFTGHRSSIKFPDLADDIVRRHSENLSDL